MKYPFWNPMKKKSQMSSTEWQLYGKKNNAWDALRDSQIAKGIWGPDERKSKHLLAREGSQILQSMNPQDQNQYSNYPMDMIPAILQINEQMGETKSTGAEYSNDDYPDEETMRGRRTCPDCTLNYGWRYLKISDYSPAEDRTHARDENGDIHTCMTTKTTWEKIKDGSCMWIRGSYENPM